MPVIAWLNGVRIVIQYLEHNPPHFHAFQAGDEVVIAIRTGRVIAGGLSRSDLRSIKKWADAHRVELLENWERATRHEVLLPI
jgi:hypothetical protein